MNEFDQSYLDYQTNRSPIRKLVRRIYLRKAASETVGRTIDFGCGAGELLSRLEPGSKGLEYNDAAVAHVRRMGLPVEHYDGYSDDWSLTPLKHGETYDSMIVSHVLEHLEQPEKVLEALMRAGAGIGVRRFVVILPQRAGYRIDATHRTFVDLPMIQNVVSNSAGWKVSSAHYFPFDLQVIGDVFVYNELHVLIDRVAN